WHSHRQDSVFLCAYPFRLAVFLGVIRERGEVRPKSCCPCRARILRRPDLPCAERPFGRSPSRFPCLRIDCPISGTFRKVDREHVSECRCRYPESISSGFQASTRTRRVLAAECREPRTSPRCPGDSRSTESGELRYPGPEEGCRQPARRLFRDGNWDKFPEVPAAVSRGPSAPEASLEEQPDCSSERPESTCPGALRP